jgi:hypothetical protein
VDPVPEPLLLRKSGSAGNRTRASGSVVFPVRYELNSYILYTRNRLLTTLFLGEINTGTWPSRFGGVSKTETVKYGHESYGIQTRGRLRLRGPATTEN